MDLEADYREKAREAARNAQLMSRADERSALREIAKHWTALADAEAAKRRGPGD